MGIYFEKQALYGIYIIKSDVYEDNRGHLVELFRKDIFNFLKFDIKQINSSYSKFKTLRGLHFQKEEYSQAKIITVQKGTILDVVVDLRNGSGSFGKYQKFVLSDSSGKILYVPKGFAHGFVTLSDEANVTYFLDNYYEEKSQSGIIWNDKILNIDWEIEFKPIISKKDENLEPFDMNKKYF